MKNEISSASHKTRDGDVKTRKCLMCQRPFKSQGPHNRICPKCTSTQAYRDGQPPSHF